MAIDLSPDLSAQIAQLQARVPVGRRVSVDNLHLTLAFLGDQSERDLESLHEALVGLSVPPFSFDLKGLEIMGGRAPRVLCLRAEPSGGLAKLHDGVRRAARLAGLTLERRRFRPHVTPARFGRVLQDTEQARLSRFVADAGLDPACRVDVQSFSLFESVLTPERAVHHVLADYPLSGLANVDG
ncbi:RNA 2',3'-cyclic phosphodiesterase [Shimia sp.]|uniref:RNA 2',3'-cyclic phosphodiesterase n=1 Tax=Shimia sp. TaxID=1954381 RepID=UPI003299AABD